MRPYKQDPSIYRNHFGRQTGGNLPGFKGARIQYGSGIGTFLGALARKAIPLIKAGVRMAAPDVKKAGNEIAKELTNRAIRKASEKMTGRAYKQRKRKVKPTKRKTTTQARTKDIFMQ